MVRPRSRMAAKSPANSRLLPPMIAVGGSGQREDVLRRRGTRRRSSSRRGGRARDPARCRAGRAPPRRCGCEPGCRAGPGCRRSARCGGGRDRRDGGSPRAGRRRDRRGRRRSAAPGTSRSSRTDAPNDATRSPRPGASSFAVAMISPSSWRCRKVEMSSGLVLGVVRRVGDHERIAPRAESLVGRLRDRREERVRDVADDQPDGAGRARAHAAGGDVRAVAEGLARDEHPVAHLRAARTAGRSAPARPWTRRRLPRGRRRGGWLSSASVATSSVPRLGTFPGNVCNATAPPPEMSRAGAEKALSAVGIARPAAASSSAPIASASYTQPPQRPPLADCSLAQSAVSAGSAGSGAMSSRTGRRSSSAAASSAVHCSSPCPTRSMEATSCAPSTTTRIRSPSRRRPIGPPSSASGLTCPMHAPVETPEKRASVISATRRPNGRNLSAEVSWYVSSMPEPSGPRPASTITSPGSIGAPRDALDRRDHVPLAREHPGRAGEPIDAVVVEHAWVDGRALDHAAAGREVALGEADGRGHPLRTRAVGRADDVVRVDPVGLEQASRAAAPCARSPPTRRARRPTCAP